MPTTPPTTGIFRPRVVASRLPASRATMSVATTAEMTRSIVGSWTGAVAIAIGVLGSLRFSTSSCTCSSPSSRERIALRTRGVGEVVAAEVGDASDHPALDEGEPGDVGGDGHRHGDHAADVGGEALGAGDPDVVLDHLVDRPLDVAALLAQLAVGRLRGRGERTDAVDRTVERLAHEPAGQGGCDLGDPRGELPLDGLLQAHATDRTGARARSPALPPEDGRTE